jgi:hypothetical protein
LRDQVLTFAWALPSILRDRSRMFDPKSHPNAEGMDPHSWIISWTRSGRNSWRHSSK